MGPELPAQYGGPAAGGTTWAGVHNTFFWVDPKSRITAVRTMRLLLANDPAVLETLAGFEAAIYASPHERRPFRTKARRVISGRDKR